MVGLSRDFIALSVFTHDDAALGDGRGEGGAEGDLSVGFGVSTLFVDAEGIVEGFGGFEGELGFNCFLVEVDGAVVCYLSFFVYCLILGGIEHVSMRNILLIYVHMTSSH